MKDHVQKSRLAMVLSMAIFGTISLFVRYLPLSSGEIALYRSVIAALPIGLFLLFSKRRLRFDVLKKQGGLLILSGFLASERMENFRAEQVNARDEKLPRMQKSAFEAVF